MDVTLGRIVHYTLDPHDVAEIADHRVRQNLGGSPVDVGQDVAALVTLTYEGEATLCNLRVIMDGYDFFWANRRELGDKPGTWHWPERAPVEPKKTSGKAGGAHV